MVPISDRTTLKLIPDRVGGLIMHIEAVEADWLLNMMLDRLIHAMNTPASPGFSVEDGRETVELLLRAETLLLKLNCAASPATQDRYREFRAHMGGQFDTLLMFVHATMVSYRKERCRACTQELLPKNAVVADGCPCNAPRGVNHGLVTTETCTCEVCDPAQTGCSRVGGPVLLPAQARK